MIRTSSRAFITAFFLFTLFPGPCRASVTSTVGTCGPANGRTFAVAPVDGLCSTGAQSAVSGSGPWNWSCTGYNGGGVAECGASLLTYPGPAVTGSCGSSNGGTFGSAPQDGLCSTGTPFHFAGYGPWSWGCAGQNGGSDATCGAGVQKWPLTVTKTGTGNGTVSSNIPNTEINCGSSCTQSYAANSIVSLSATAAATSQFIGWSGCDSTSGTLCSVTLDAQKNVSASFVQLPTDVKVGGNFYPDISSGLGILNQNDLLQLRSTDFPAPPVFNRPINYQVGGGYDSTFSSASGVSRIHGPLTVSAGTVKLGNVRVAEPLPSPGNAGAISTVTVNGSGASLLISPATSSTPGANLQYQVYYSAQPLNNVNDMLSYGTPVGAPSPLGSGWVEGKANGGLYFSGSDYVDGGNGSSLNFGAGSFTIEAWVFPTSFVNCGVIINKGAAGAGGAGYTLRETTSAGNNYLQLLVADGAHLGVATAQVSGPGIWYHVVAVVDRANSVAQLYVNGTLSATASLTGFGSTSSGTDLVIGGSGSFIKGIVDEAAVYNRALSFSEVIDHYNSGSGKSLPATSGMVGGWHFDEASGSSAADLTGAGNTGALHFSASTLAVNVSGLAPSSTYYLNVMVTDQYGNKAAFSPMTLTTPDSVTPITFEGSIIPGTGMFHPIVADLYNTGFIAPLGTINDGQGNLTAVTAASMGLSKLFAPGRIQRTCSIADFNGDGLPDIVCNVFSSHEIYTNPDPICQAANSINPYSPNSVAMLFFNNGDGTFTESTQFTNLALRGLHGETILAADFNNDGCLDLFWPHTSYCSPNDQNYLLINDCHGNFTEVADIAGVAVRNFDINYRGEGAQALDFNGDGWIDIYAGSHLFINNGAKNGIPTFTDMREAYGLPLAFDEGFKFTDWNNDGYLDMVIHHPTSGPVLYQFDGKQFHKTNAIPSYLFSESYGLNVFDMNNDGKEDIMVAGGTNVAGLPNPTVVLLNTGTGFQRVTTPMDAWGQDTISFGDFSNSGKLDIMKRESDNGGVGLAYMKNMTPVPSNSSFKLELVGPNGEHNQQGRIVKIYPQNHPGVIFTRFVDSGSGYLTQSPYEIFVGTPYPEPHRVEAFFYGKTVNFTINPGERKRVFPDGAVVNY